MWGYSDFCKDLIKLLVFLKTKLNTGTVFEHLLNISYAIMNISYAIIYSKLTLNGNIFCLCSDKNNLGLSLNR